MSDIYKAPDAELTQPQNVGEYGSVERAIVGDYQFQIGEVIKESWAKLKGLKTNIWLAALVYIAILMPLTFVAGFASAFLGLNGVLSQLIIQLVTTAIGLPIGAGIMMIALKHSVGAPHQVGEVFKHFNKIIPLTITTILMYLMIIVGLLLLVLPGIYLMFAYYMAIPLVVEKGMSPWQALETSRKAVTKKWFRFLGFVIVIMILITLSALPLMIGLIWTVPMSIFAYAIVYRNMFGVEASSTH